ncbi:phage tail tape measure protein [Thalassobaculum sp. OXR-137]|uniref:phage tail tape measure protein n=1 Tax=Thalassobaculum sp. OXR-137 TaxID=3100173 RepID=UPI002AC9750F|nr:phage tail tape measure protein [Thalassobaculum sp. OXR-137]WPZ33229.1 phage tail tape measure protein [Thalassobaculum sp. OXR-137]
MTDIVVGLTLRADGRGFVGEVRNARSELAGLRDSGTGAGRALEDLRLRSSSALASLRSLQTVIAGLGLAIGVRDAVQEFAAYERGLVGVAKTADLSADQIREMGAAVTEMARRMPFARTELLGIAQAGGQLGVKGVKDLTLFTETVAKLGTASDLAGEEAATSLTRILNVTGEAIDSIDTLASVIVALGNNAAASESEIARVATQVAQATAIFGVSAGEAAGFGAALRSVGVQAELGGSAVGRTFRAIEESIRGGGQRFRELAEITGIAGDQLRQTFEQDATSVFVSFVEGVGAAVESGESAAEVLERFGLQGEELLKVLPTLAVNSDQLSRFLGIVADETRNTTALNEEYLRSAQTLSSQLALTGNALDEIAASLGSALAPAIVEATDDLRSFVQEAVDSGDVAATFDAVAYAVGALSSNLDILAATVGVGIFARMRPGIVGVLQSINALVPAVASSTASWVTLNAAVATGSAVDLNSARATELKAAAQVAAARASVEATASTLAQVKAERARAVVVAGSAEADLARIAVGRQVLAIEAQLLAQKNALAAAEARHLAALQATTVGARTATIAMRGLSGAMNLIGGPAGAALLAAGGIYYLATRQSEASQAAELHARAIEGVNRQLGLGAGLSQDAAQRAREEAEASLALTEALIAETQVRATRGGQMRRAAQEDLAEYKRQAQELREGLKLLDVQGELRALFDGNEGLFGAGGLSGILPTSGPGGGADFGGLATDVQSLVDQLDPMAKVMREASDAEEQLRASHEKLTAAGYDVEALIKALNHGTDAYAFGLGAAARAAREQAQDTTLALQVRKLEAEGTEQARQEIVRLTAARELDRLESRRQQAVMAAAPGQIGEINAAYAELRAAVLATRDAELEWSSGQDEALKALRARLDPIAEKYRDVDQQAQLLMRGFEAGKLTYEQYLDLIARLGDQVEAWAAAQNQAADAMVRSAEDLEFQNEIRRLELENTDEARRRIVALTTARKLEQLELERSRALLEALPEQIDAVNAAYDRMRKAIMDEGQVRELERIKDQANPLAEAFKTAAEGIQRGFSDAITNVVRNGKLQFKDLAGSAKDIFARMFGEIATLAIAKPIIVPIVGALGQAVGLSPSAIASITGQFGGGAGGLTGALPAFSGGGGGLIGGIGAGMGLINLLRGGSLTTGSATIGNLFASLGSRLGGAELGATFGNAGLAFGSPLGSIGSFATNLLLDQLLGDRGIGSTIGSTIGAVAGSFFGPFGTIAGSALGNVVGGLFGGGQTPSVGPTGVARIPNVIGTSEIQLSADNDGDPTAAGEVARRIREIATEASDRYGATGSRAYGLDVGAFSNPEGGSGQSAGFNLKEIINGQLADKDLFRGLSADEAVTEGVRLTLQKAFDGFDTDRVSTALQNSSAKTIEELLSDLDFAAGLDELFLPDLDIAGPLKTQLDALKDAFEEAKERAKELGLATENLADNYATAVTQVQQGFRTSLEAEAAGVGGQYNQLLSLAAQLKQLSTDAEVAGVSADTLAQVIDGRFRPVIEGLGAGELQALIDAFSGVADQVQGADIILRELTETLNSQVVDSLTQTAATTAEIAEQQEQARNTLIEAYKRESAELQTLRDRMMGFANSIRETRRGLEVSDLAKGGPTDRLDAAKGIFDDVFERAQAGNEDAIAGIEQAAQNYLQIAREVLVGADYNAAFDMTADRLSRVESVAKQQAQIADQQLAQMQMQVSQLVSINDNVISVADAIRDLEAVLAAAPNAATPSGGSAGDISDQYTREERYLARNSDVAAWAQATAAAEGVTDPDQLRVRLNQLAYQHAHEYGIAEGREYEKGGWHPGGPAIVHPGELLYTGGPMHVFNAQQSLALMSRPANTNTMDMTPLVGAIGRTTSAIYSAGDRQAMATADLAGQVERMGMTIADQGRQIRDLSMQLSKRSS